MKTRGRRLIPPPKTGRKTLIEVYECRSIFFAFFDELGLAIGAWTTGCCFSVVELPSWVACDSREQVVVGKLWLFSMGIMKVCCTGGRKKEKLIIR